VLSSSAQPLRLLQMLSTASDHHGAGRTPLWRRGQPPQRDHARTAGAEAGSSEIYPDDPPAVGGRSAAAAERGRAGQDGRRLVAGA